MPAFQFLGWPDQRWCAGGTGVTGRRPPEQQRVGRQRRAEVQRWYGFFLSSGKTRPSAMQMLNWTRCRTGNATEP